MSDKGKTTVQPTDEARPPADPPGRKTIIGMPPLTSPAPDMDDDDISRLVAACKPAQDAAPAPDATTPATAAAPADGAAAALPTAPDPAAAGDEPLPENSVLLAPRRQQYWPIFLTALVVALGLGFIGWSLHRLLPPNKALDEMAQAETTPTPQLGSTAQPGTGAPAPTGGPATVPQHKTVHYLDLTGCKPEQVRVDPQTGETVHPRDCATYRVSRVEIK